MRRSRSLIYREPNSSREVFKQKFNSDAWRSELEVLGVRSNHVDQIKPLFKERNLPNHPDELVNVLKCSSTLLDDSKTFFGSKLTFDNTPVSN